MPIPTIRTVEQAKGVQVSEIASNVSIPLSGGQSHGGRASRMSVKEVMPDEIGYPDAKLAHRHHRLDAEGLQAPRSGVVSQIFPGSFASTIAVERGKATSGTLVGLAAIEAHHSDTPQHYQGVSILPIAPNEDYIGQVPGHIGPGLSTVVREPRVGISWPISRPETDVEDPLHHAVQAFMDSTSSEQYSRSAVEAARSIVRAATGRLVQPDIEFDEEEGILSLDIRLDSQRLLVARLKLTGELTVNVYDDQEGVWLEHLPNIVAQELVNRL